MSLKSDLRRFKNLTTGHAVIMGRVTFETIGRPLPHRRNIVLTRGDFRADGCDVVHSLEEALAVACGDCFVIGGAEIYRQALPLADTVFETVVEAEFVGDRYFGPLGSEWVLSESSHLYPDEDSPYGLRFLTWRKEVAHD